MTFALDGTERGVVYLLYKDGRSTGVTLTGTGGAASFTGLVGKGTGVYSVRVDSSAAFCAATMIGAYMVAERPLPAGLSLTSATICQTQPAVLTAMATDTSRNLEYSITGSAWTPATVKSYDSGSHDCLDAAWETSATFSVKPTVDTAYPLYVRTAEGCSVTLVAAATVTVLPPPPVFIIQPNSKNICLGTTAMLSAFASPATDYRWNKNGDPTTEGNNYDMADYTTPPLTESAVYSVTVTNTGCPIEVTSREVVVSITAMGSTGCGTNCTLPEATVNFSAFAPCPDAVTGTSWYLTDDRETGNKQTYKVKKIGDNLIFMVQDLKFGDKCKNNNFSSTSVSDTRNAISTTGDYFGNCTNAVVSETFAIRGYLYDWAAAVNLEGAYEGGTATGCAGDDQSCQGICPNGWHVPTLKEAEGIISLCERCKGNCDALEWHFGGWYSESSGHQAVGERQHIWLSTSETKQNAKQFLAKQDCSNIDLMSSATKVCALSVRCLRNY